MQCTILKLYKMEDGAYQAYIKNWHGRRIYIRLSIEGERCNAMECFYIDRVKRTEPVLFVTREFALKDFLEIIATELDRKYIAFDFVDDEVISKEEFIAKAISTEKYSILSCTGKTHNHACEGIRRTIYVDSLEDMIYELITEKIASLKKYRKVISTDNTNKINVLRNRLSQIETEQQKIVNILMIGEVNEYTIALVNKKAADLSKEASEILTQIADLEVADSDVVSVMNLSKKWQKANFEERKAVYYVLIDKIFIHQDGTAEIIWNI